MARPEDIVGNGKNKKRNSRKDKRSKLSAPSSKSTTRISDVYEAEENDPQEELKAGQRYDVSDRSFDLHRPGICCNSLRQNYWYWACSELTITNTNFPQILRMRK